MVSEQFDKRFGHAHRSDGEAPRRREKRMGPVLPSGQRGMSPVRRRRAVQIWAYMSKRIAEGHSPSIKEIAAEIGVGDADGYVHSLIDELVGLGYISRGPKQTNRTYTVNIPFIIGAACPHKLRLYRRRNVRQIG